MEGYFILVLGLGLSSCVIGFRVVVILCCYDGGFDGGKL